MKGVSFKKRWLITGLGRSAGFIENIRTEVGQPIIENIFKKCGNNTYFVNFVRFRRSLIPNFKFTKKCCIPKIQLDFKFYPSIGF